MLLALSAASCAGSEPCYWAPDQDRDSGAVALTSLECDGTPNEQGRLRAFYRADSAPLALEIDAMAFRVQLYFDPSLPDGTYAVAPPEQSATAAVTGAGALVTGTFTFSRSRDIPFLDIAAPKARDYESSIDATFDLVAALPHPDPAMGPGCTLVTGERQVSLVVSGPVVECSGGPAVGGWH